MLVVLVALVALQAAALAAVAAWYLLAGLADANSGGLSGAATFFFALISLVAGLGLLAAARGLLRQRRSARAPVLVVQLIIALVVVGPDGVVSGGLWHLGLPLLVWAVAVTFLLFLPRISALLAE